MQKQICLVAELLMKVVVFIRHIACDVVNITSPQVLILISGQILFLIVHLWLLLT